MTPIVSKSQIKVGLFVNQQASNHLPSVALTYESKCITYKNFINLLSQQISENIFTLLSCGPKNNKSIFNAVT